MSTRNWIVIFAFALTAALGLPAVAGMSDFDAAGNVIEGPLQ